MTDRNTSKIEGFALALVVFLAGVGLALGGVAAQSGSSDLVDDSIDVTNDTESIYVDVTGAADMNGSSPIDVNVTVEGLASNQSVGNGTVLNETTLSVAENATESVDVALSDSDRTDYDSVHVSVSTTADVSLIDSYDWGSVGAISGGGGGGLGGVGGSTGVVAILVVVAALVFMRDN